MNNPERNLERLFSQIQNYFSPKIIGEVNDVYIKLAKVKGDDVPWHTHDHEDEMFYVIKGSLVMEEKGEDSFTLNEGELHIVKQGIEHRVYCNDECWLMLAENKGTKHTGDVPSKITKSEDEQMY
jgi:quercetin dioxygenase-like cupin family protein